MDPTFLSHVPILIQKATRIYDQPVTKWRQGEKSKNATEQPLLTNFCNIWWIQTISSFQVKPFAFHCKGGNTVLYWGIWARIWKARIWKISFHIRTKKNAQFLQILFLTFKLSKSHVSQFLPVIHNLLERHAFGGIHMFIITALNPIQFFFLIRHLHWDKVKFWKILKAVIEVWRLTFLTDLPGSPEGMVFCSHLSKNSNKGLGTELKTPVLIRQR